MGRDCWLQYVRIFYSFIFWDDVDKNAEYLITCAELEGDDLLGHAITVVHATRPGEHVPEVSIDELHRSKQPGKPLTASLSENTFQDSVDVNIKPRISSPPEDNHAGVVKGDSAESNTLLDGRPITNSMVKDEPVSQVVPIIEFPVFDIDKEEGIANSEEQAKTSQNPDAPGAIDNLKLTSCKEDGIQPSSSHDSSPASPERAALHYKAQRSFSKREDEEKRINILNMLDKLRHPRFEVGYLDSILTCFTYVLHTWTNKQSGSRMEQPEVLSKLERSISSATKLRSVCELEAQSSMFVQDLAYREAMMIGIGITDSSIQNELESLGTAVLDAIELLHLVSGSIAFGPKTRITSSKARGKAEVATDGDNLTGEHKHTTEDIATPPFLTWTWLSSEFDGSVHPEKLAAENLLAALQEIDGNLTHRKETSYTHATEISLTELERRLMRVKLQPSSPSRSPGGFPVVSALITPTRSRAQLLGDVSSPFRQPLGHLLDEDAILRRQKDAILETGAELASTTKMFVSLFIPCTKQHRLARRIWGSLSSLLEVSTFLLRSFSGKAASYTLNLGLSSELSALSELSIICRHIETS